MIKNHGMFCCGKDTKAAIVLAASPVCAPAYGNDGASPDKHVRKSSMNLTD